MIITLKIIAHAPCAQIFAIADLKESPYLGAFTNMKFWHNNATSSISYHPYLDIYDNDQYVTFKSSVPFGQFCKILDESEFNNPRKYHYLKHNCTHAAAFALKVANIMDVPNWVIFNRVGDRFYQRIPLFSFAPHDLYYLARDKKLKSLKEERVDFKYELAKHSLLFRARQTTDNCKKQNITQLILASEKFKKEQPEHAVMHLKTLVRTIDLLLKKASDDYEYYYKLQRYHHHRDPYLWPGAPFPAGINAVAIVILGNFGAIQAGLVKPSNEVSVSNILMQFIIGCCIGFVMMRSLYKISTHRPIQSSKLSEAMREMLLNTSFVEKNSHSELSHQTPEFLS